MALALMAKREEVLRRYLRHSILTVGLPVLLESLMERADLAAGLFLTVKLMAPRSNGDHDLISLVIKAILRPHFDLPRQGSSKGILMAGPKSHAALLAFPLAAPQLGC